MKQGRFITAGSMCNQSEETYSTYDMCKLLREFYELLGDCSPDMVEFYQQEMSVAIRRGESKNPLIRH